jgi:hypothetical protein
MAGEVWLTAVIFLLAYEGFALATGRTTLSRFVWTTDKSQYGPLLPFLVGLLCGHFFWSGQ